MKKFAPIVLRYGLVFVFLWFGIKQISDQSTWVSIVPDWATSLSGLSATTIVYLNGILEVFLAVMLAIGYRVRFASFILFVHMVAIIFSIGLTATGVRDIGIAFALFSVFLHGGDEYSL